VKMFIRDAFPGISNVFKSSPVNPSSGSTPPSNENSS
jgi:hypothetical protein